jgi:hypothetical protein
VSLAQSFVLDSVHAWPSTLATPSVLPATAQLNSFVSGRGHLEAILVFLEARSSALPGFHTFPTFCSFKRFVVILISF